jgi:sulfur carrier protein
VAPDVTSVTSEIGLLSLFVNGERRSVPAPCSVSALLRALALEARRIAIAVNGDVVPRSGFGERELASGDRIEILEAVGGG